MTLHRYTFPDAYILEELQRAYQVADTKGRIRLLRKLYRGEQRAPFEIALLAVEDPQVEVRQWIALMAIVSTTVGLVPSTLTII